MGHPVYIKNQKYRRKNTMQQVHRGSKGAQKELTLSYHWHTEGQSHLQTLLQPKQVLRGQTVLYIYVMDIVGSCDVLRVSAWGERVIHRGATQLKSIYRDPEEGIADPERKTTSIFPYLGIKEVNYLKKYARRRCGHSLRAWVNRQCSRTVISDQKDVRKDRMTN